MSSDGFCNANGGEEKEANCLLALVDTARTQLISPPPEEMLRKNLRPTIPSCLRVEASLDIKPSRSDATPPTEVSKPRRKVSSSAVQTKSTRKSSKRKKIALAPDFKSAKCKKKGSTLNIVTAVKQELPDIDLTLPMSPASPTDDPLLLIGPPEPDFFLDSMMLSRRRKMSTATVAPGCMEGVGEYTGRWKMILMRTKQDPSSDAAKEKIQEWGRLHSPSPKFLVKQEEREEEKHVRRMSVEPELLFGKENEEEEEVSRMFIEPEELLGENEREEETRRMCFESEQSFGTGDKEEENVMRMTVESEQLLGRDQDQDQEGVGFVSVKPEQLLGKEEEETMGMSLEPERLLGEDEEGQEEVKRVSVEPEQLLRKDQDEDQEEVRFVPVNPEQLLGKEEEEAETMGMSFGPEQLLRKDEDEQEEVRRMSFEPPAQLLGKEKEKEQETMEMLFEPRQLLGKDDDEGPEGVRHMFVEPEQLWGKDEDEDQEEVGRMFFEPEHLLGKESGEEVWRMSVEPQESLGNEEDVRREPDQLLGKEKERMEEGQDLCQFSVELDDDEETASPFDNPDLLPSQITSANLRATEDAAAISKQPDDCYLNMEVKRQAKRRQKSAIENFAKESRRRSIFTPGVPKGIGSRRRRSTLGMGVISDRVFIPGSPVITLHELLQESKLDWRDPHLLEVTNAISQEESILPPGQETQDSSPHSGVEDTSHSPDVPSMTAGKCFKNFLFSYLPTLPKSSSTARKDPLFPQPSLPLPPIDILSKPRGPAITPTRAPLLKPKHPKELVILHPAPQPPTILYIPNMKKPQRLVELHPPPPPPVTEATPILRPSGNSVKDLVRGFEEIQAHSLGKRKCDGDRKKCSNKRRKPC